jgi:hypothetical protein
MLDTDRFHWGVSLDNLWTYAGLPPPKPIPLPFVLSLRMPRGPAASLNAPKLFTHHLLHRLSRDEAEQDSAVKELCVELAKTLKEARIGFVRSWFPWNFFDRRIGEERHFLMDTFVETMRAAGIEILAVLGNGYSRFLPEGLGPNTSRSTWIDWCPPQRR